MANGIMGNPQTPAPQEQPQEQPRGPINKGLSAGLTKLGMAFMGSAFTQTGSPELGEAFNRMGDDLAASLHQRWWQEEFEMFQKQYVTKFKEGVHGLIDNRQQQLDLLNMGQLADAQGNILDPASEAAVRMRANIERNAVLEMGTMVDDLMAASGKYVNNPMVNNTIQNIAQTTTDRIGQMLNPAMTVQNERAVANVALTRAQAKAAKESGSSASRMKRPEMDLYELLDDFGYDYNRLASYMATTPDGRKRLNQVWGAAEADYRGMLIQEDPTLQADPERLNTMLAAGQDELVNFATGKMIQDTFGTTAANQLKSSEKGNQWFPLEPQELKPKIRTALTGSKKQEFAKETAEFALQEIHKYIATENPRSLQDAVNYIQEVWLPGYMNSLVERNKNTNDARSYIINYVTKFLGDEHNITDNLELARDKFGKKKGLLRTARDYGKEVGKHQAGLLPSKEGN